jgi:hypothetical protein
MEQQVIGRHGTPVEKIDDLDFTEAVGGNRALDLVADCRQG